MRKVLPILLVMLCSQLVIGQNVGINNNTPDASSILDVTSTDKGVLLPRVSLTDVTDNTSPIASPAEGLLIYNTNDTVVGGDGVGFYYFDGTEWVKLISDAALTVDGLTDADNDTKIQVEETSDEDFIRFDVKGNEVMVIDSNGRVGINVDQPSYTLDVYAGSNYDSTSSIVFDLPVGTYQNSGQSSNGWQSFTATTDALLDSVAFKINITASNSYNERSFRIYEGEGTGGTLLYSTPTLTFPTGVDHHYFSVDDTVYIQAGQKYTIWIDKTYRLYFDYTNPYPDGRGSLVSNYDFEIQIKGFAGGSGNFSVGDGKVIVGSYTLPLSDGTSGQVLTTNGMGTVSWEVPAFEQDTLTIVSDADGDTKIQVEETTDDDIIRFDVKGTEVAVIRNDKIGVGVTNPNAKLDVDGTIRLNNNDLLFRHGTDTYHGLGWRNSTGGSTFAGFSPNGPVLYGYDGGVLGTTGGGERSVLNWTKDGYVGIGTTGPDASLDLVGTFQFVDGNQQNGFVLTSDASGNATWQANVVDTDDQTLSLSGTELTIVDGNTVDLSSLVDDGDWTVSGTKMYNLNSGYVGIGTTNPSQELHVVNNTTTGFTTIEVENNASGGGANIIFDTDNISNAQVGVNGSGHSSHPNTLFVYNDNHPLRLYAGGGDRIYIASNGKIGINNTDPQEDLHIDGSLRIEDGNQQNGYVLTSDASGNATWQALVIDTLTYVKDTDGDTKIQVEESSDEDVIRFDVAGNEAMVIGSTGGVGVNIDAPDQGLRVAISGYTNAVDQAVTTSTNALSLTTPATQSFTAGVSGDLTAVALRHYQAPASDSLTITIYEGNGTSGTVLYSDRIEITNGWNTMTISGVQVVSGSVYTIGVDDRYGWAVNVNDIYSGGYYNHAASGYDALFKTYVTGYHTEGSFSVDTLVRINDYSFPSADGTSGQVMTTDGAGTVSWANTVGDDLGNHTADQNIELDGNWLSGDGGNEGVYVASDGDVGIGTASPEVSLHVKGNGSQPVAIFEETNTSPNIALVDATNGMRFEYNSNQDELRIQTANTDGSYGGELIAVFEASGNVGIGTNDPAGPLHVYAPSSSMEPNLILTGGNGTNTFDDGVQIAFGYSGTTNYQHFIHTRHNASNSKNAIDFYVSDGTQSNSLTSGSVHTMSLVSGSVGIGTTNPGHTLEVEGAATGDFVAHIKNTATSNTNTTQYNGLKITAGRNTRNGVNSRMVAFYTPDDTEIGRVHQNGNTSVSYTTSSDVRLKMNIAPTKFGIGDLMNIQVKDYEFKSQPGFVRTGYLAQDLYNVYPEAVSKGGEDVKSDPWMVDYGAMTPLLVKSIQDQQQEIEELKRELQELKQLIEKN